MFLFMDEKTVADVDHGDDCEACTSGWGHQVSMTQGGDCKFRCRGCRAETVVHAQQEHWCCEHRYVGEDLWRAEEYYDTWACPECSGGYGVHDDDCGS